MLVILNEAFKTLFSSFSTCNPLTYGWILPPAVKSTTFNSLAMSIFLFVLRNAFRKSSSLKQFRIGQVFRQKKPLKRFRHIQRLCVTLGVFVWSLNINAWFLFPQVGNKRKYKITLAFLRMGYKTLCVKKN